MPSSGWQAGLLGHFQHFSLYTILHAICWRSAGPVVHSSPWKGTPPTPSLQSASSPAEYRRRMKSGRGFSSSLSLSVVHAPLNKVVASLPPRVRLSVTSPHFPHSLAVTVLWDERIRRENILAAGRPSSSSSSLYLRGMARRREGEVASRVQNGGESSGRQSRAAANLVKCLLLSHWYPKYITEKKKRFHTI